MDHKAKIVEDAPVFGDSFSEETLPARKAVRWITIPLSLVLHLFVLAALIVVPVLSVADMPEISVADVRVMKVPATPGVPPGPAGSARGRETVKKPVRPDQPAVTASGRLQAPLKPPEKIELFFDPAAFTAEGSGYSGPTVEGGDPDATLAVQGEWMQGLITERDAAGESRAAAISVRQPRKIKEVAPVYPFGGRVNVSGVVVIEAETDIYGRVRNARVISGHPLLNQAALDAVMQWQYQPYIVNGIPKPVKFTVTVTFSLQNQ